ncbi:MAG: hypothetical protein AAF483_27100 [Planctomycetota bacterium]
MDVDKYQQELREAYVRGGPGAIVSGIVWGAAGLMSQSYSIGIGFAVLFFAGMLIFPISKIVLKLIFRRPAESRDNPGGLIVIETVFPMIGGLFAAWLLLPHRAEFVFPLASIAVGAHYFGFRSAYGDWTYWVFGAALFLIGSLSIIVGLPSGKLIPFIVAFVEIGFGIWFIIVDARAKTLDGSDEKMNL